MKLSNISSLLERARDVESAVGKSVLQQFSEILALRFCKPPLDYSEYYDYGAWNPALSAAERAEFIGWRRNALVNEVLNDGAFILAGDKLINYALLDNLGFPIPEIVAVYNKQGRRHADAPVLQSAEDVRGFVEAADYPFFVKPISSGTARGSASVKSWDAASQSLVMHNDKRLSFDEFFADFDTKAYGGKVLQKTLQPNPAIVELTGSSSVSGLRAICLMTPKGPLVHSVILKLTTGGNATDNFDDGNAGNYIGWVNVETGRVEYAISRLGLGGEINEHPVTHKPIVGFEVPNWSQIVELLKDICINFPGLRIQSWDVALCEQGPVMLETNARGDLKPWQATCKRGLMDARFREVFEDALKHPSLYRTEIPKY